jgi:hypothetical protein
VIENVNHPAGVVSHVYGGGWWENLLSFKDVG